MKRMPQMKTQNPSWSRMRKKNLRLTSPQLCPQFLVGQGEYSSLRPRHTWDVGEDVLSTVKPCTCQYSFFSFFFTSQALYWKNIRECPLPKKCFFETNTYMGSRNQKIQHWTGILKASWGLQQWRPKPREHWTHNVREKSRSLQEATLNKTPKYLKILKRFI